MPLFNYGRVPGQTPSGRGVKYSADEAKAAQILADTNAYGAKPGQYSQQQIDWAKSILPDTAPVVIPKRLASPAGIDNPLDAFAFGIQRFGRAPQQSAIDAFNTKYGTQYSAPQLFDYSQKFAGMPGTDLGQSLTKNILNLQNAAPVTSVANGITPNPAAPPTTVLPSGRSATADPTGYSLAPNFLQNQGALSAAGQWNDANDPGGFIRKSLNKTATQSPYVPNWGSPGLVYGIGGNRKI